MSQRRKLIIGIVAGVVAVVVGGLVVGALWLQSEQRDFTPAEVATPAPGSPATELRVAAQIGDRFIGSEGITENTRFRIASVTKMFTAVVLVQLADEGEISLDHPISDYLAVDVDATIGEILSHRSGIIDNTEGQEYRDAFDNLDEPLDPSALTDRATITDSDGMSYSNAGYIFAGDVIETVTGQHPAEAIAERITGPLGMTSTCWPGVDDDCEADLPGVINRTEFGGPDEDVLITTFTSVDRMTDASGALISTTADLTTFMTAFVDGDLAGAAEIVASAAGDDFRVGFMERFLSPQEAYGLGIAANEDGTVGHDGQTFGFQSYVFIDPETNEPVILLVNDSTVDTYKLSRLVMDQGTAPTVTDILGLR